MKNLLLLLCVLFTLTPLNAATFNAEKTVLDNGMEVIIIPNHRAPIVHHMLWYNVGAADEDWGKSGLAHLFEHLMFRGTSTLKDGEYSKTIAKLGGRDNAFTSQDYTAYHVSIGKEHLKQVMEMETDRMTNLILDEEILETERQVVIEERKQRLENNPFARFHERLNTTLYPNHPYALPTIGWLHEIEGYTLSDLKSFYQKWYAPNNTRLIISGDVKLEEVLPLIKETYGKISPRNSFDNRFRPKIPENLTPGLKQHLTFTDPQITQTYWSETRLVPSHNMDFAFSLALDIVLSILDGDKAAPIQRLLVKEQELAISASLSYNSGRIDYAPLTLQATLKEKKDVEPFKEGLSILLRSYKENGFSIEEIDNAKRRMIDTIDYTRDGLTGPAQIFGQTLGTGLTFEQIENWETHLKEITKEQIDEVFKNYVLDYIDPISSVEALLLPPHDMKDN